MDFKKFGKIILILGMLILLYGGFQWISNQPKKFDPAESKQTIFGRNDLGNMLEVNETNMVREAKRDDAVKIIIAGSIVIFLGFGISNSAKKKEHDYPISSTSNRKEKIYCANCGKEYSSESAGDYCGNCGNKL